MTNNFILIDGSYFCFYRYYSMLKWWKNCHPNIPLDDPINNEIFVEKYKNTFIEKIHDISKKLDIKNPILIVGKDCKRANIWRNELYKDYKGTRDRDQFKGGPIFKMVYDEDLFIQAGVNSILFHNKLEADDCIAIACNHLLMTYPDSKITIIANDKDYLQLREKRVQIINLEFTDISKSKWLTCLQNNKLVDDPTCDLFCKIIMGDISDNISSVLPKCGPKTALKYFNNRLLFESQLIKYNANDKYKLNTNLIDFKAIPVQLITEFIHLNIEKLLF